MNLDPLQILLIKAALVVFVAFGVAVMAVVQLIRLILWAAALYRHRRATGRDRREARHTEQARQAAGFADQKTELIDLSAQETLLFARYDQEVFGRSRLARRFERKVTR